MIKAIENNFSNKRIRIEYMLGNLCNHKCSYCFPGSNEGDHPWPDKDLVKENLGHLLKKYKENGRTEPILYLIGGEPTLWKDLPEVCEYFQKEHNCRIVISTNGSRSRKWWKENSKFFNEILLSVHHEYANIDHLKKVCDVIYENDVFVIANVLMDPRSFKKCQEIIKDLKISNCNWPILSQSVQFNGQTFYSDEQKAYLKNRLKRLPDVDWYDKVGPIEITKLKITLEDDKVLEVEGDQWPSINNLNHFKGFKCNIGLEQVKIFQSGIITANCREKIFGVESPFNLYDSDFKDKFNPKFNSVTCTKNICSCKSEIAVTKWMP